MKDPGTVGIWRLLAGFFIYLSVVTVTEILCLKCTRVVWLRERKKISTRTHCYKASEDPCKITIYLERQVMITTKGLPTLTKLYQTVDIKLHFLLHMILECGELKMQVLAAKYPEFTSRHHIPHAYNRREGWWQRSPKLLRQNPLGELAIPYLTWIKTGEA
jgi:hypothetical protein